jgi:hypothetical protein
MIDLNRPADQHRGAWPPGHSGDLAADRVGVDSGWLVTADRPTKKQDAAGPAGQAPRRATPPIWGGWHVPDRVEVVAEGEDQCPFPLSKAGGLAAGEFAS